MLDLTRRAISISVSVSAVVKKAKTIHGYPFHLKVQRAVLGWGLGETP